MASFRLTVASVQNCPPPQKVAKALEDFGLPESEEFGVVSQHATDTTVFGTILRKSQQAIQRLDAKTGQISSTAVEKVTTYSFGIKPSTGWLELYSGPVAGIGQVGAFLSGALALPTVVTELKVDIPAALEKLAANTKNFQLKSVRISDYAHNSYMSGVYAPKFLDTEHGKEFLEQYADFVTAAGVRFAAPKGKAGVSLSPKASFGYSCSEDDQTFVQTILRKIV